MLLACALATSAKLSFSARMQTANPVIEKGLLAALPRGLKTLAVANVIRETEKAWRKETSNDFALTMAALDKALRDAEERMGWLSRWRGSRPSTKNQTEPQPE